jgi:hypothetical protein
LGVLLIVIGLFSMIVLPWLFPVEQKFTMGGGELSWALPNVTLMYIGLGIVILGALLSACWFFGKLTGRF